MDYDITVIGAGPGGYVAAIAAAQRQKRVCIIERGKEGGVCLNEGCIPTKTLIKTVNLYDELKKADDFGIKGIDTSNISIDLSKLQARKESVVSRLRGGVSGLLKGNGVTIINGSAAFKDRNTVIVDEKEITSEYFIIATGSSAYMPPFIAVDGDSNVITSREALDILQIPKAIGIIGGGVIGIEFAYIFSKLGAEVFVFEMMDQILPMLDKEVSEMAKKRLEQAGIEFFCGAKVTAIKDNHIFFEHEGNSLNKSADCVLMAVGRTPDTDGLNAEAIGLELNNGAIKTSETMQTNIQNIYAVGDVNGVSMLAHTASHEGIIAVKNICGQAGVMDYSRVPSCIYIEPEIACIGLTEEQASKTCDIKVGRFPLAGNGKALVEGETEGLAKVILDSSTGEILGAHLYGIRATDMISEISTAMAAEATGDEIINAIHPHPTVSEIIPEAFMDALGRAIHWM